MIKCYVQIETLQYLKKFKGANTYAIHRTLLGSCLAHYIHWLLSYIKFVRSYLGDLLTKMMLS